MPFAQSFVIKLSKQFLPWRKIPIPKTLKGFMVGRAPESGLAIVEFRVPGIFEPISAILSGRPFGLKPGQWTEDSSMAPYLSDINKSY
jgi:hypothetical protein